MVILWPEWLGELSFQLSFLATLGLIVAQPILDLVIPGNKNTPLRDDFVTTSAAQLLVWPLIAYHFGQVSVLSPVVNALILWMVPILTYIGLVTITLSYVIKGVSLLIMLPNRLLLDPFIWIVRLFSSFKIGYFEVSPFGMVALLFYFLVLGEALWLIYQKCQRKREIA